MASTTNLQPAASDIKKIRTHHLQKFKNTGQRFAMLTSYDQNTAEIFDRNGIEVLLVGDSAANNVYGHASTLQATLEEIIPLTRAVATHAHRALVVADLPFGSYQNSPEQAVASSVRLMKEGLAHAVKLEGGAHHASHIKAIVAAGIPVMAHIGFTPQSEHALGGFKIQGQGEEAAQGIINDARAVEAAGAFSIVIEMTAAETAARIESTISIPTIGIGAGNQTTGQVLVWQDMLGLTGTKTPRFVKQYADLRTIIAQATQEYVRDVKNGAFPSPEHTY